jgi:leucine dehydrogenase
MQGSASSANNQFPETAHGDEFHSRGILYAPGYAINTGGLTSAYIDWKKSGTDRIMKKVPKIEDRKGELIAASKKTGEPTHTIAEKLGERGSRGKNAERGRLKARKRMIR